MQGNEFFSTWVANKAVYRTRMALADGGELLAKLEADGEIVVELPDGLVTLDSDDIKVRLNAKEDWSGRRRAPSVFPWIRQ